MATLIRRGEPVRFETWGVTIDSLVHPTRYIVIRYATSARRHSEPYEEVLRLPYGRGATEEVIDELAGRTGMPRGTASRLVTNLEAQVTSPRRDRLASAEQGYRPVR